MLVPTSLLAFLPFLASAAPAPIPADGLNVNNAISWTAGRVSRIGDKSPIGAQTTWGWYDCGEPGDAVSIKSIKVSPDPPRPGHDLTIYAAGTVNTLVDEGAYADVVVKLGLIKLLTKRFDLCEELSNANATLQCPVEPNEYNIVQTVALPQEIPRAKFVVDVKAFTQLDEPAACLQLQINFLAPTPAKALKLEEEY